MKFSKQAQQIKERIDELEDYITNIDDTINELETERDNLNEKVDKFYEVIRKETGCDCYALGIECKGHVEGGVR